MKSERIIDGLVSVIMTNYNTPKDYLRQAIESILNQTYTDFEFIIIDDASTDDSLSVIESYKDDRIVILKNKENIGLTKSLNIGLGICKGEFIARMDSDDISEPQRFEKQVEFLKTHPDVIVCGTWATLIGDWEKYNSTNTQCRMIPNRETFRIYQLFGNNPNIIHISAMFNHLLLKQNDILYDERYTYAQDYRMWISCNQKSNCIVVPEFLVKIRIRNGTISTSKKECQKDCVIRIIQEQLDKLHLTLSDEIKKYHIGLLNERKPYDTTIKLWINEIISANKKYKVYNHRILKKLLWDKWAEICYFGLASENSLNKKASVLFSVPLSRLPLLFKIRKDRKMKTL